MGLNFVSFSGASARKPNPAMRFTDPAKDGARDGLLHRYFDDEIAGREFAENLRNLYPNNAEAMLGNRLTVNLLRKVVDTKAKLYRRPPKRKLLDANGREPDLGHPAHRVFQALIRDTRVNHHMKWLLRYYELLNGAALWVQFDWRTNTPCLSLLPPQRLWVEPSENDPGNPMEAKAILVPIGTKASGGFLRFARMRLSDGVLRIHASKLDADLDPVPEQPPELSAYAALDRYPFVFLRKYTPLSGVVWPDPPYGLLHASRWLDHELTRGALNSRLTDFPAYVFNGEADELGAVNPATGAGAIICLGDGDKKLTPLPADPREEERNANISFFLKVFAQANDMTPSAFTFDNDLQSGTAKFHDKQPEIEYREDLMDMVRPVEESDLWPLCFRMAGIAGFAEAEALDGFRVVLDFPDQVIPLSKEEELRNLETEMRLGLRSAADVLAERQGLSPESARKKARENEAELKTGKEITE